MLLDHLHKQWQRQSLDGKRVHYRVRWAPDDLRFGTIARVKDLTLFIGCFCFSHTDIVSMTEIE